MSSSARWCSLYCPPLLNWKCEWVWHFGSILKFSLLFTKQSTSHPRNALNLESFWKYILITDMNQQPSTHDHLWLFCHLVKGIFHLIRLWNVIMSLVCHDIFYSDEQSNLVEITQLETSKWLWLEIQMESQAVWTFLSLLACHQSIKASFMIYLKETVWASASHKCCLIGFGPSPPNPHTTHITTSTTPHPLHTASPKHASTEQCFHHTEQRRAKRQLGQRGHNLSGNSAAKPQITFGGSLDWKSLSKFILVLQRPISRWAVYKKPFKVFLLPFVQS